MTELDILNCVFFRKLGWLETCGNHVGMAYEHCAKMKTEDYGCWLENISKNVICQHTTAHVSVQLHMCKDGCESSSRDFTELAEMILERESCRILSRQNDGKILCDKIRFERALTVLYFVDNWKIFAIH